MPTFSGFEKMQQREQHAEQRRVVGRPFPPGVSGNPDGKSKTVRQAKLDALVATWTAPVGGVDKLSPAERVLAYQAATLALRRPTRAEDAVRVANTIAKIMHQCGLVNRHRRRELPKAEAPDIKSYAKAAP